MGVKHVIHECCKEAVHVNRTTGVVHLAVTCSAEKIQSLHWNYRASDARGSPYRPGYNGILQQTSSNRGGRNGRHGISTRRRTLDDYDITLGRGLYEEKIEEDHSIDGSGTNGGVRESDHAKWGYKVVS